MANNMNPTSAVLDENGELCVTVNRRGFTRLYMARQEYEDCHDIVHTQEIGMQCTTAIRLRDTLNEVFPMEITEQDLGKVPVDALINELARRERVEVIPFSENIDMYIDNCDEVRHIKDHSGTAIVIDKGENTAEVVDDGNNSDQQERVL